MTMGTRDAVYAVDSYIETGKSPTMDGMFKDWCEAWKGLANVLNEQTKSNEPIDDKVSSALSCPYIGVAPYLGPRRDVAPYYLIPKPVYGSAHTIQTNSDRNLFTGIILSSVGRNVSDLLSHTEDAWLPEPSDDDLSNSAWYDLHERLPVVHRAAILSTGRSALASHAPFLPFCREVLVSFEAFENVDGDARIGDLLKDIDYLLDTNREYTMENIRKSLRTEYPSKQETIESAMTLLWDQPDRDWAAVQEGIEWLSAIGQDPGSQENPSEEVLAHFRQLADDSAVMDAIEDWETFVLRIARMARRNPLVSDWLNDTGKGPRVRSDSM